MRNDDIIFMPDFSNKPSHSVIGDLLLSDKMIDKIFEKLYTKKVIITCRWCGSANAFDNTNCVYCGGPPG